MALRAKKAICASITSRRRDRPSIRPNTRATPSVRSTTTVCFNRRLSGSTAQDVVGLANLCWLRVYAFVERQPLFFQSAVVEMVHDQVGEPGGDRASAGSLAHTLRNLARDAYGDTTDCHTISTL